MKASAYKQYGDAAILSLVLEALPQIAAEVSAPLAKTDEIVLIGRFFLVAQLLFFIYNFFESPSIKKRVGISHERKLLKSSGISNIQTKMKFSFLSHRMALICFLTKIHL